MTDQRDETGTDTPTPLRVVLVDDHEVLRAGFRVIFGADPGIDVVGEAADGATAVREVARLRPDVVLMDVQMPGVDGLAATRRILEAADESDPIKVVVLTTFDREDYLFGALQAGASGFLLKNAAPEEIVESVRIVARGDALLAPEVTRKVISRFAGAAPASVTQRPTDLTDREHDVLVLLARGASNAEIAERLFLGETTVKTHVSRILVKLGVRDRTHAVVFAYENGIVTPGGR